MPARRIRRQDSRPKASKGPSSTPHTVLDSDEFSRPVVPEVRRVLLSGRPGRDATPVPSPTATTPAPARPPTAASPAVPVKHRDRAFTVLDVGGVLHADDLHDALGGDPSDLLVICCVCRSSSNAATAVLNELTRHGATPAFSPSPPADQVISCTVTLERVVYLNVLCDVDFTPGEHGRHAMREPQLRAMQAALWAFQMSHVVLVCSDTVPDTSLVESLRRVIEFMPDKSAAPLFAFARTCATVDAFDSLAADSESAAALARCAGLALAAMAQPTELGGAPAALMLVPPPETAQPAPTSLVGGRAWPERGAQRVISFERAVAHLRSQLYVVHRPGPQAPSRIKCVYLLALFLFLYSFMAADAGCVQERCTKDVGARVAYAQNQAVITQ